MPSFANLTGITFVDTTTVPQTLAVSGLTGSISQISVTLSGLTHTFLEDLDLLLVGPDGTHNLLFWWTLAASMMPRTQLSRSLIPAPRGYPFFSRS